jgi:hypothetical protein
MLTVNLTITEPILCNGGSGQVSIAGLGGTAPYVGNGIFTVASGVQTFTVTDANGCNAQTTVTITEPAPLVATSSATDELLGADGTATVNVSGGTAPYTYSWTPGGESTPSISGLVAGLYMVTVTDANGCSVTLEEQVGSQVGLSMLNQETALSVYPNPSATAIKVNNSTSTVFDKVGVYTSEGRLLVEFSLVGNESRILDISSWSPGRYVLKHASGVLPIVKL